MTARTSTRPPAVAGLFYTADPRALSAQVDALLEAGRGHLDERAAAPPAIIAPHAGYRYSGAVAGIAFAAAARRRPARVVLIGPAHRVAFRGLADAAAGAFETPLGRLPVDTDALATLERAAMITSRPDAHAEEHCLEVLLPFVQRAFGAVPVVPLLVGRATTAQVSAALDALLRSDDLLVVSTDLSHFHPYDDARRRDLATLEAIVVGDAEQLAGDDACGHRGVAGAMALATERGWSASVLAYQNSGDTAGDRDRVVGYGALAVG